MIVSQVRTTDSAGRVWIKTETRPGYPVTAPAMGPASPVTMCPDADLARLARLLAATTGADHDAIAAVAAQITAR